MSIAEDISEGIFCQECGAYIDDEDYDGSGPCGYPRFCLGCDGDPECNGAKKTVRRSPVLKRVVERKNKRKTP